MDNDDLYLWQSQWLDLSELLVITNADITALRLRLLAELRPAILYLHDDKTVLTDTADKYTCRVITKVLTTLTEWSDDDDPHTASVQFSKPALIDWISNTNIDADLTTLKSWQRDVLPTLKEKGLLVTTASSTPTGTTAATTTPSMTLSADELIELTGRSRNSAQLAALNAMGIDFKTRPNGSLVVLRDALTTYQQKPKAKPAPNLDVLTRRRA